MTVGFDVLHSQKLINAALRSSPSVPSCYTDVILTSLVCQSLLHSEQWFYSSAVWAHCELAPCNSRTHQLLPQAQPGINTKIKQRYTVNNTARVYCRFDFCSLDQGNKTGKSLTDCERWTGLWLSFLSFTSFWCSLSLILLSLKPKDLSWLFFDWLRKQAVNL